MADARGSLAFSIFLWIFIVLLIIWLVGWLAFHIVVGFWHVILVIALIALIVHFVRPHPTTRP